ncbi:DUF4350 domain-containing protein [Thermogladius calderae]|uniref:DUF4350 domain-containing protein n=1 Tax=Thermogladius calderae TaxID=1200300 RepID=UPI00064FE759|nr:DUF4350 domain-containing protein [Thermogladius calderae]
MSEWRVRVRSTLSIFLILSLVAIGLISLAEKGGPGLPVFKGAAPFNTGEIGTSSLVEMLRERYGSVYVITNLSELANLPLSGSCLFVTVSPERPYTEAESNEILSSLARCRDIKLLIADENTTSNALLKAAGAPLRVAEVVVLVQQSGLLRLVYDPSTRQYLPPYPVSRFNVAGKVYDVVLDIASYINVSGGNATVFGEYYVGNKTLVSGAVAWSSISLDGQKRDVETVVLSDGSVFLNQVIDRNETYRQFALDLFQSICGTGGCQIVFDASRYTPIPLTDIMNDINGITPLYVSFPTLLGMIIANLIHPSTWFAPLLDYSNSLLKEALQNQLVASVFSVLLALLAFVYFSRGESFIRDRPMGEERLVEVAYAANIREEIVRGKLKLGKEDFKSLYELVDQVMLSVYGLGLKDADLVKRLSEVTGPEKARRYVDAMNKLYGKATGARRTPIVLSWHRTVLKYARESDEVLSKIGVSLMRVEVLEKIARR